MGRIRAKRSDYFWFTGISTRWMDNDTYGHVNNVTYYSYFDTAANRYLIDVGGLDIHSGESVGLVVESRCHYHAALSFPQKIDVGLRVDHLGGRSVTYGIAVFAHDAAEAAAHGHFVHVFVDRKSHRPLPAMPEHLRKALVDIQVK